MSTPVAAAQRLIHSLREDRFFLCLLVVAFGFALWHPQDVAHYPALVDWSTIATLAGLLMLTKGIELSGALLRLGHRLVVAMHTERSLALLLVCATALLSTLLTNDVALFVMVPLTLGLARSAALPITRLVIFEAMAANAGSTLTPIGNPQNLFLWHQSGLPFEQFTAAMLPLTALLMLALVAMTLLAFRVRPLSLNGEASTHPVNSTLLLTCLLLFPVFLILTDLHRDGLALLLVLAVMLALQRRTITETDWGLILVFILMFIDLRLVAQLPQIRQLLDGTRLDDARHLYLVAIAASQCISNVPAAILLAEYSKDWRVIAFGVNAGAFGFLLGSLANLIALRLLARFAASGEAKVDAEHAVLRFHAWSAPFLLVAGVLVWAWLFWF